MKYLLPSSPDEGFFALHINNWSGGPILITRATSRSLMQVMRTETFFGEPSCTTVVHNLKKDKNRRNMR